MSSHHFVREGQEPALFMIDPIPFHSIGPLLEWSPMVVVDFNALDNAISWGVRVDAVVCSRERATMVDQKLDGHFPAAMVYAENTADSLSSGIRFLLDHQQQGVNIISVNPGIFDIVGSLHGLRLNIFDATVKWSAISFARFEKWLPAGERIKVRKSTASQIIQFQGLTTLDGEFEATASGMVSIASDELFWVGELHI
jgi:hypothetical protein